MNRRIVLVACIPLVMGTAQASIDSLLAFSNSRSVLASVPLSSIRKITVDPYNLSIDTGAVVQRPIGGSTVGPVTVVFRASSTDRVFQPIRAGAPSRSLVMYRPSRIDVALPGDAAGVAWVSVFSTDGREVRRLSVAAVPTRAVSWDCATFSGTRARPGVYHVVGSASGRRVVNATVLVK
jgi:hypothetical protein